MSDKKKARYRPLAEPKYDVGYGRPPTRFQFKKGISGNPSGRPSGQPKAKVLGVDVKNVQPQARELTDEELLRILKERKLSLDALLNAYEVQIDDDGSNATPKRQPPR